MKRVWQTIKSSIGAIFIILVIALAGNQVSADDSQRQTTITVSYIEYEWWLLRWSTNEIVCQIQIDHEGLPTNQEVLNACEALIFDEWINTPPCTSIVNSGEVSNCSGLYLHFISSHPGEREVTIDLPSPVVWITIRGCTPIPPENLCSTLPDLLFIGEEPLPDESITSIEGTFNARPFECQSSECAIPLQSTPPEGVPVEFWANSSFGDSTEIYTAIVRVVESGVTQPGASAGWHVDVISSQWRGPRLASCSETWEALPPIGGMTSWLSTPPASEFMASNEAYYYLAGRLIAQGALDARDCPTGGLQVNGYADTCGLEKAKPLVENWQNQFDSRMVEVAEETGVPSQLMKNLFAQESQFWPGMFKVHYEFGLGQLTDNGADAILLWNFSFYHKFCPTVLSEETCSVGYIHLDSDEQALLRGALAFQASSDCKECPIGVDLTDVEYTIPLFANTLLANCEQVGQIVYNATGKIAGQVSSYEDLWRYTVANYHAGPGCLSFAIFTAASNNDDQRLTWDEIVPRFTEPCQGVIPYVEKITQ